MDDGRDSQSQAAAGSGSQSADNVSGSAAGGPRLAPIFSQAGNKPGCILFCTHVLLVFSDYLGINKSIGIAKSLSTYIPSGDRSL